MESDWLFKLILTSLLSSHSRTEGCLLQFYYSYDPSNQNVQLEYVMDTILDMRDTFSGNNE